MQDNQSDNKQRTKGLRKLILMPVLMFGFGFAMVPLYDVFCDITGLNGKTGDQVRVSDLSQQVSDRIVKVQFTTHRQGNPPWQFYPKESQIEVRVGDLNKAFFVVRNKLAEGMDLQAIPSVSPSEAAPYLHKTECFCFRQQTLTAKEVKEMPLVFQLDAGLPEHITKITLSYTMYQFAENNHNNNVTSQQQSAAAGSM